MQKFLITIINILFIKFPTLISVVLAFIIESKISISKYISVFAEYEHVHELNIALYTIILEKIITYIRGYLERYIVNIECYFYEKKSDANKEKSYSVLEVEIKEDPIQVYLGVKYSAYYRDLKKYYLEITFPTWVDLNDFPETSMLKLDEKVIEEGLSYSTVVFDFSKVDIEENNYKEGRRIIPLYFIINSIESLGDKELIEVKIKSNKKIKVYEFQSNKLELSGAL